MKVFPCGHFPVYGTANFWQSYLRKAIDHNEYLPTSSPSTFSCIDDKIADLQASVHEKVDGEEEMGKHPLIISDFLLRTCIDLARLVKAGSHYIQYHAPK